MERRSTNLAWQVREDKSQEVNSGEHAKVTEEWRHGNLGNLWVVLLEQRLCWWRAERGGMKQKRKAELRSQWALDPTLRRMDIFLQAESKSIISGLWWMPNGSIWFHPTFFFSHYLTFLGACAWGGPNCIFETPGAGMWPGPGHLVFSIFLVREIDFCMTKCSGLQVQSSTTLTQKCYLTPKSYKKKVLGLSLLDQRESYCHAEINLSDQEDGKH